MHGDVEGEFTAVKRPPGSHKMEFVPLTVGGTVRRETTETCVHEVPPSLHLHLRLLLFLWLLLLLSGNRVAHASK